MSKEVLAKLDSMHTTINDIDKRLIAVEAVLPTLLTK